MKVWQKGIDMAEEKAQVVGVNKNPGPENDDDV